MSVVRREVVLGIAGALTVAASLTLIGCGGTEAPEGTTTAAAVPAAAADPVERGEYLVAIMGCDDCHTPFAMGPDGPAPDMTRRLSGHPEDLQMPAPPQDAVWAWSGALTNTAFAGPWGISYATNLTPDEATGMAIWSEDMFIAALRDGKKFGAGRPLLPPMPWPAYAHATDEDLKAIFAYLQTLEPVANQVPEAQINPPPA